MEISWITSGRCEIVECALEVFKGSMVISFALKREVVSTKVCRYRKKGRAKNNYKRGRDVKQAGLSLSVVRCIAAKLAALRPTTDISRSAALCGTLRSVREGPSPRDLGKLLAAHTMNPEQVGTSRQRFTFAWNGRPFWPSTRTAFPNQRRFLDHLDWGCGEYVG